MKRKKNNFPPLCSLRSDGSLKAALLYYRQRHLLVLRCAALFIKKGTFAAVRLGWGSTRLRRAFI